MATTSSPAADTTTPAFLTRDQILDISDRRVEPVAVPEWGGTVRVRSLTGRERDKFEASLLDKQGNARRTLDARAKLAQLCIVDERGQLLFGEDDIRALSNKSAAALNRVFEKAQQLAGLTEEDLEELEGN
ncbi:hypothetical protein ACLQ2R_03170 [Streptosporangium sp. DT93]|uniref:hypothetical protein n=1 Tax=Streptosporangium sp. DT93 TaxID=3393428 RepID=UPI003CEFF004